MKKINICPRCGSTDIKIEMGPLVGTGKPNPYVCQNCGFSSMFFPEIDNEKAKEVKVKKEKILSTHPNHLIQVMESFW